MRKFKKGDYVRVVSTYLEVAGTVGRVERIIDEGGCIRRDYPVGIIPLYSLASGILKDCTAEGENPYIFYDDYWYFRDDELVLITETEAVLARMRGL